MVGELSEMMTQLTAHKTCHVPTQYPKAVEFPFVAFCARRKYSADLGYPVSIPFVNYYPGVHKALVIVIESKNEYWQRKSPLER